MSKGQLIPEFSREKRGVVLLTKREAQALHEFLDAYKLLALTMNNTDDLARAYRVLGNQLRWIAEQEKQVDVSKAWKCE